MHSQDRAAHMLCSGSVFGLRQCLGSTTGRLNAGPNMRKGRPVLQPVWRVLGNLLQLCHQCVAVQVAQLAHTTLQLEECTTNATCISHTHAQMLDHNLQGAKPPPLLFGPLNVSLMARQVLADHKPEPADLCALEQAATSTPGSQHPWPT